MTKKKANELDLGLYKIFWKEKHGGGVSLAAVGYDQAGNRWFAPTNWLEVPSFDWAKVEKAVLLHARADLDA